MFSSGAEDLSGFIQAGSTNPEYWVNGSGNGVAVVGFRPGRLQRANAQDSGCGVNPRWKHKGPSCPGSTPARTGSQWAAEGAFSALIGTSVIGRSAGFLQLSLAFH